MEFMAMPCIRSITAIRRLSGVQLSTEGEIPENSKVAAGFLMSMTRIPPGRPPVDEVTNIVASGDHAIGMLLWFGSFLKVFGNHRETSAMRWVRLFFMPVI